MRPEGPDPADTVDAAADSTVTAADSAPKADGPAVTADPEAVIEAALKSAELSFERPRPGAFLVRLPGQHKLATLTWLIVGDQALSIEAFFCRKPDENHAEFYRWLLLKNGSMYGVHFAVDSLGDVHLVGRLPLSSVTEAEIDRILGCVLTYSDEYFDRALELGFASSIRREWEWRVKRGESLANLQPFARVIDS